jgi:tetratricopeptide (TPR) repeat protein
MTIIQRFKFILPVAALCAACALPPPREERQSFIPERELQAVSLAREGLYYFGRSRYFDAEVKLRQAVALVPDPNLRIDLAVVLEYEGALDEAEAIYKSLLLDQPDDPQILAGLARLYAVRGDSEAGKRHYIQAIEKVLSVSDKTLQAGSLKRASAYSRSLAALSFKIGDEAGARCYSEEAWLISQNPEDLVRHTRMLIATGFNERARQAMEQYMEKRGSKIDAGLLHELALAQYGLGKMSESVKLEDKALDQIGSAPGIQAEVELVRFAAAEFKFEPTEDEEAASDSGGEQEDPVESAVKSKVMESGATLYWPVNLLEAVGRYGRERGYLTSDGAAAPPPKSWLRRLFGGA